MPFIETDAVEIQAPVSPAFQEILTPEALDFVSTLHREFNGRRQSLLQNRQVVQSDLDAGKWPSFPPETQAIRQDGSWAVATPPGDLQKRHVEITGPVERKMMINALNSGADVFMADFEDSNSPTWENILQGQVNLRDAVNRTITFTNPDGKRYALKENTATLMVRPRGWHLPEKHLLMDGQPVSASLFDFGLYFFHNVAQLLNNGSGPYFYLPKLENHLEARLWNDVFCTAEDLLAVPRGTIKATVLIENILAAFEMEEILFELKEHSAGLNAGRWDYIFSIIKKFRNRPEVTLPDRAQITMTVPFMRAYTELLVQTCHKRGAHAIGGMAAFIPSRDPHVNETAMRKVREDKDRESQDGFDGTWVAHPGLVPVARESFLRALQGKPHQKDKLREDVRVRASNLLNFTVPDGEITEQGLRTNINVGILYLESWLRGSGAAALYNLMEDAATAEISRAQVWQWLHNPQTRLNDGRPVTAGLYSQIRSEEMQAIERLVGRDRYASGQVELAGRLFDDLINSRHFADFLTLKAYKHLS